MHGEYRIYNQLQGIGYSCKRISECSTAIEQNTQKQTAQSIRFNYKQFTSAVSRNTILAKDIQEGDILLDLFSILLLNHLQYKSPLKHCYSLLNKTFTNRFLC